MGSIHVQSGAVMVPGLAGEILTDNQGLECCCDSGGECPCNAQSFQLSHENVDWDLEYNGGANQCQGYTDAGETVILRPSCAYTKNGLFQFDGNPATWNPGGCGTNSFDWQFSIGSPTGPNEWVVIVRIRQQSPNSDPDEISGLQVTALNVPIAGGCPLPGSYAIDDVLPLPGPSGGVIVNDPGILVIG